MAVEAEREAVSAAEAVVEGPRRAAMPGWRRQAPLLTPVDEEV